ncbi:MAG: glycoside hydrolase family 47 protein [Ignavibacteriaceae bacterium]
MKSFVSYALTTLILSIFISLPFTYGQNLSSAKNKNQISNINKNKLAEEVKKEFIHAWNGYKEYAWGHDELRPLSRSYRDWYKVSLCMTPVDAFDTMVLMGLKKQADEAKELIFNHLSFDQNIRVKNAWWVAFILSIRWR